MNDAHAAADGHATGAAAHEPNHMREYTRTILVLSGLTVLEFLIAFSMNPDRAPVNPLGFTFPMMFGIVLLVALAFVKATLVGRFFMHLKYDPKLLGFLAVIPLILIVPFLAFIGWDMVKGPIF